MAEELRFGDGWAEALGAGRPPPPIRRGRKEASHAPLIHPTTSRGRYGRVTLAAAVALTVAVAIPVVLHHGSDPTMVSAAAESAGSDAPSTTVTTTAPVDPADLLTVSDEHKLAVIASNPLLRMSEAYRNGTPEERALRSTCSWPHPLRPLRLRPLRRRPPSRSR